MDSSDTQTTSFAHPSLPPSPTHSMMISEGTQEHKHLNLPDTPTRTQVHARIPREFFHLGREGRRGGENLNSPKKTQEQKYEQIDQETKENKEKKGEKESKTRKIKNKVCCTAYKIREILVRVTRLLSFPFLQLRIFLHGHSSSSPRFSPSWLPDPETLSHCSRILFPPSLLRQLRPQQSYSSLRCLTHDDDDDGDGVATSKTSFCLSVCCAPSKATSEKPTPANHTQAKTTRQTRDTHKTQKTHRFTQCRVHESRFSRRLSFPLPLAAQGRALRCAALESRFSRILTSRFSRWLPIRFY